MDIKRNGNFTSSEIVALTTNGRATGTFGKPFYTYVNETNMERRLMKSLSNETFAKPLTWGKLVEKKVFEILGLDYKPCSQETLDHPTVEYWKGSPDAQRFYADGSTAIVDIKCPMTLKSFCTFIDSYQAGGINEIREQHQDGDKYYWQLVSNAIITGTNKAELIIYVPYTTELESIKQLAHQVNPVDSPKYYWIAMGLDEELPSLNPNGVYKNLNVLPFEIPQRDIDFLTERVLKAGESLIPFINIKS